MFLFHGVSDNRTGDLGHAEFLLRRGYGVVMMDSRAHGQSGGDMATYGWKERYDTVAITDALYATEKVRHLYAHGVSMGAAIALQSAAVEPRIAAVSAEDPFASLREVTYDYAGLDMSLFLGKTLFRPASIFAMRAVARNRRLQSRRSLAGKSCRGTPVPRSADLRNERSQNSLPSRASHLRCRDWTERIVDRARSRTRLSTRASSGRI